MRASVSIGDVREIQRRMAWHIWWHRWLYERKLKAQQKQISQRARSNTTSPAPNLYLFEVRTLAEEMSAAETYLIMREAEAATSMRAPVGMSVAYIEREQKHSHCASLYEVVWRAAAPFIKHTDTSAQAAEVINLLDSCVELIMRQNHQEVIQQMYNGNYPVIAWSTLPSGVRVAVAQTYFSSVLLGVAFESVHNMFWTTCAMRMRDVTQLVGINAGDRMKVLYADCLKNFNDRYQAHLTRTQRNASGDTIADDDDVTAADPMLTDPAFVGSAPPSASSMIPQLLDTVIVSSQLLHHHDHHSMKTSNKKKDKKKKKDKEKEKEKEQSEDKSQSPRMRAKSGMFNRIASAFGAGGPTQTPSSSEGGATRSPRQDTDSIRQRSTSISSISLTYSLSEGGMRSSSSSSPSLETLPESIRNDFNVSRRERSDRQVEVPLPSPSRLVSTMGRVHSNSASVTPTGSGLNSEASSSSPSPRSSSTHGPVMFEPQVAMHLLSLFAKFCWDSYSTDARANSTSSTSTSEGSTGDNNNNNATGVACVLAVPPIACSMEDGIAPLLKHFDLTEVSQDIPCYVTTPVHVMSFIWQLTPELRQSPLIHNTLNTAHTTRNDIITFGAEFTKTLQIRAMARSTSVPGNTTHAELATLRVCDILTAYRICALIVLVAQVNARHTKLQSQIMLSGQAVQGNAPLAMLQRCSREFQDLHKKFIEQLNGLKRSSPQKGTTALARRPSATSASSSEQDNSNTNNSETED